ncbi:glucose-6-phosphate 1-epimerase [Acrasis kona]|uniref:Glucose-6-phosphate 1-epimerase n=1 Tax=Acrasis kona TaxID=1008807 RepID=A0AAW2ZGY3_9EUKA
MPKIKMCDTQAPTQKARPLTSPSIGFAVVGIEKNDMDGVIGLFKTNIIANDSSLHLLKRYLEHQSTDYLALYNEIQEWKRETDASIRSHMVVMIIQIFVLSTVHKKNRDLRIELTYDRIMHNNTWHRVEDIEGTIDHIEHLVVEEMMKIFAKFDKKTTKNNIRNRSFCDAKTKTKTWDLLKNKLQSPLFRINLL